MSSKSNKDENWDFKVDETAIKENDLKRSKVSPKRKIPKKSGKLKLNEQPQGTRKKTGSLARRNARLAKYAEIKNASLISRVLAQLIDTVIFSVLYVPCIVFTDKVFSLLTPHFYRLNLESIVKISTLRSNDYVFYGVVIYFFILVIPSVFSKKSFGKKLMHLRIGHKFEDTPTSKKSVFLRELLKPLSIASILGLLVMFINQDRRALHDLLFSTRVYDED